MPFTRGDATQFAVGLGMAIVGAVVLNLGALQDTSLREIDWAETGWALADNIVQSVIVYLTAWWGIRRTQQVVPAIQVVPRTEEVIAPIKPPGDAS